MISLEVGLHLYQESLEAIGVGTPEARVISNCESPDLSTGYVYACVCIHIHSCIHVAEAALGRNCLSLISVVVIKYPDQKHLEEKGFILGHNSRL